MKYIFCLVIMIIFGNCFSLTESRAKEFIKALIKEDSSLEKYISKDYLKHSKNLPIEYKVSYPKEFISYELTDKDKKFLRSHSNDFKIIKEENLDILNIENFNLEKSYKYYFKENKLISPIAVHLATYNIKESKYFRYYSKADSPDNVLEKLDLYIEKMSEVLGFSKKDLKILKKKKISYLFCENNSVIEKITGYSARGMLNLSHNMVITTYKAHYHEVAHLLINFKLKDVNLYTHPLLLEGFAVCFGDRGGNEIGINRNLGKFLIDSQFVDINDLLDKEGFYNIDASLSYPVAGRFTEFYFEQYGLDDFIRIYSLYSSNKFNTITNIEEINLKEFLHFNSKKMIQPIEFLAYRKTKQPKFNDRRIYRSGKYLHCNFDGEQFWTISDSLVLRISANQNEIKVYCTKTGNCIAIFSQGFDLSGTIIPILNGKPSFSINIERLKDVYDLNIL